MPSKVQTSVQSHHRRLWIWLIIIPGLYLLLAYLVLPALWRHYEHNSKLEHSPKTTQTAQGIPGDPLNVGLVGTKVEVVQAILAAGWYPADPITFNSSLGIAKSVLLKRPYPNAPVSNLYFLGRKQDLAFELPVGNSAKERHHVRLWQTNNLSADGRPLWVGSATFDTSVELSRFTGQITHHIDSNIDAERDNFIQSLEKAHLVSNLYQVTGVGATLFGRNGGGDWYNTDGELTVGVLSLNNTVQSITPTQLPNPAPVEIKNRAWLWLRHLFTHK
ncbi:LssY C-terminal domain-containing protein [Brasilonema sp. CT11]|nr:LssY C-terminal domain-containing protein [Brasilonema sp. CT11]